jgi:PilZ domain-containing protein
MSTEANYDALCFGQRTELNHQLVSMELRNRVRYRLSADAVFVWEGPKHNRLLGEGLTRDISVAGAFIFTRTCPPVGAILELDIFLSPVPGGSRRTVRIKTEARVIRVEHSGAGEGFAAVSQDFTLLFDSNTRNAFGVSSADEGGGDPSD